MSSRWVVAILIICALSMLADDKTLQKYAGKLFQDKIILIRNFYANSTLEYDVNGKLVNQPEVSCWQRGQIQIESVKVDGKVLQLKGHRLIGTYDPTKAQFVEEFAKTDEVKIYIELAGLTAGQDELNHALNQIFLTNADDLNRVIANAGPDSGYSRGERVLGTKGVAPPKVISSPDPAPTEEARKKGVDGTVILWILIGSDGHVCEEKISRSLGWGLDEAAARAVAAWRFKPATKDGKPIPVGVNVEVNFHLH